MKYLTNFELGFIAGGEDCYCGDLDFVLEGYENSTEWRSFSGEGECYDHCCLDEKTDFYRFGGVVRSCSCECYLDELGEEFDGYDGMMVI